MDDRTLDLVEHAIDSAADYLFCRQRADGSWQDHLPSSAVSTGTALVALATADRVGNAAMLAQGAQWLRSAQHTDGSWGDALVDQGNLNGTVIAIAALQLVDPAASRAAVARGMAFIEANGGMAAVEDRARCSLSVICRTLMAQAGLYPWEQLGRIPLELILLPNGLKQKVSFTLPGAFAWGLMHARTRPAGPLRRLINRIAEPRALEWLEGIQAYEGYRGGFEESPLMVAIVYFGLVRASVGRAIADRCDAYLRSTRRPDGSWPINRDLEFSASMFVLMGLQAAGYGDDPRLRPTLEWIWRSQRQTPFYPTGCPAGGWGWSLPSGWPNTDDTSSALTVLPQMGVAKTDRRLLRGVAWLLAMQNKNGAWTCFVKDGNLSLDQACPIFTAHALIALHESADCDPAHPAVRRALAYFQRIQRGDGSIHAMWYRNYTSGTAFVLDAYATLGLASDPVARRCREWLLINQNDDGSWGGARGQAGTVEETAWALSALLASGEPASGRQLTGAARWLAEQQQPDGGWVPSVIGVYFLALFYSSDQLANGYVLQALGRYRQALRSELSHSPALLQTA